MESFRGLLFIESGCQKIDRPNHIAKANKFKKISREKPTRVVFQKTHSQTYLQSPKSMKSSSLSNQSNIE
jgi:hypothetical protein